MPDDDDVLTSEHSHADIAKQINDAIQSIYQGWLMEDMPVIRLMHPDAAAIIPMYRSAVVVMAQTAEDIEKGRAVLRVYHDPGWMGHDSTPENFEQHCATIRFYGDRHTPKCHYSPPACRDGGVEFHGCFEQQERLEDLYRHLYEDLLERHHAHMKEHEHAEQTPSS